MLLSSKILRVFICLCALSVGAQVSGQDKLSDSQLQVIRKYTSELFKVADADENGTLDAEEQTKLRRLEDAADSDSNGEITFEELLGYFVGKATESKSRLKSKSKRRGGGLPAAVSPKVKSSVGELTGKVKMIQDGDRITLVGAPDDIKAVEAAVSELKAGSAAAAGKNSSLGLKVWIVKSSDAFDVTSVDGASAASVKSKLAEMKDDSTVQIESLHFSAIEGRTVEFKNTRQVPVVENISVRNGNTSRQVTKDSVGSVLELKASRHGKQILLECDFHKSLVEKSDVALFEDENETVFAPIVSEMDFETIISCTPGKASVFQSSKDGSRWSLVVVAGDE